ncbi:hypothetical protein [Streptococcus acidominimus]|uniref:Uncharacterized protein n=1 Tax=Streptococcus acidominimus TaxID=1326 RepID=A0A1Q8E7M9_STRAI|nr:hypothetical protein [Streptococcus acidominimus]OLF47798.1 hypothetical protein BU200_09975 [Streptococcus acidominimus]SUN07784.1 Uncharacterised protein [Streptococcus acidominimus]
MHNPIQKVTLSDLLSKIPDNDFDWYIFEIEAIGVAPKGMSMPEFENLVLESERGYNISWTELWDLSKNLCDLNSLILVSATNPITFEALEKSSSIIKVKLEIIDSSIWELNLYEDFS